MKVWLCGENQLNLAEVTEVVIIISDIPVSDQVSCSRLYGRRTEVSSMSEDHNEAQSELNIARKKIMECDSQINAIVMERQRIQHKVSEANLERKKNGE
ncbi:hypothetical protein ACS0TY_032371 [Phlomoides rotata]